MSQAIPFEIAEALSAAGFAIGSVSGGTVIAAGVVLIAGVYFIAKAGEKVKDIAVTAESMKKQKECCCNAVGPSGKFKLHFIMLPSKKKAEEAARHYANANGVECHPSNTKDKFPHYHPTRNGKKIPGVHFQYPK
ncbi:hypothetical protein H8356DRAFT_1072577 [Neocallimastix lanati (nom. inval.)]|jgi:hypothetical protein|uniref:Uncharacterized protein n=1 Tax=Neocallimastix californiae TaxID=1754190 RepID=A0A1Y2EQY0_9FUNG|nr:hypothetical protein H8356DRAFT_1072577 [Neocallimastix sp. JGI-2020a]ORY73990.1 hypothetical protein LY90DRAFT_699446 [Neocallimastix californiae]|eukprot:ORY73990.1 hypothetical protein LY90DRAFT_699446 [Neocallimastix californiae]